MLKANKVGISLLLPLIVFLIVIGIVPVVFSLYISFHSWAIIRQKPLIFVGLGNFKDLIIYNREFCNSFIRSIIFTGSVVAIESFLGFMIAVGLYKWGKTEKVFTALFIMPLMFAPIVIALQWRLLFNTRYGIINWILRSLNIVQVSVNWLGSSPESFFSIIIVDIWHWTPLMYLISLAGLQSLPQDLVDAARVDGASFRYQLICIVIPLLKKILLIGILIRSITAFMLFDEILGLTFGGPGNTTEMLSWFVYKQGFRYFNIGYAASASWLVLIIISVISIGLIKAVTKFK